MNLKVNLDTDFGKIPPQSIDMEEAVLGAIILEKNAIMSVIDIIQPESFYKDCNQKIYSAILELLKNGNPIDALTVTEKLRQLSILDEVGGAYYITQLINRIGSSAHIEFHARIVQEKYLKREFIRISSDIQKMAYDESIDISELIEFSELNIFSVNQNISISEAVKLKDVLIETIENIKQASESTSNLIGLPSGLNKLDRITNGWQKPDLIILAARPSMGKTAFALFFAKQAAMIKKPVLIFSLEMSKIQLANRLISSETDISPTVLLSGKFHESKWEHISKSSIKLGNMPIYIDDSSNLTIYELRAKVRRLRMMYQIELVMIDYLQLMSGAKKDKGNREQEISEISRGLKQLAKEIDIPVIALSQLNRSVEIRAGTKKPQLSDLRESGAIEQDADIVVFIHRPEKYGITEDEENESTEGMTNLIIAKHRNGAIGEISVYNNESLTKITDFRDNNSYDPDLFIEPNEKFNDDKPF